MGASTSMNEKIMDLVDERHEAGTGESSSQRMMESSSSSSSQMWYTEHPQTDYEESTIHERVSQHTVDNDGFLRVLPNSYESNEMVNESQTKSIEPSDRTDTSIVGTGITEQRERDENVTESQNIESLCFSFLQDPDQDACMVDTKLAESTENLTISQNTESCLPSVLPDRATATVGTQQNENENATESQNIESICLSFLPDPDQDACMVGTKLAESTENFTILQNTESCLPSVLPDRATAIVGTQLLESQNIESLCLSFLQDPDQDACMVGTEPIESHTHVTDSQNGSHENRTESQNTESSLSIVLPDPQQDRSIISAGIEQNKSQKNAMRSQNIKSALLLLCLSDPAFVSTEQKESIESVTESHNMRPSLLAVSHPEHDASIVSTGTKNNESNEIAAESQNMKSALLFLSHPDQDACIVGTEQTESTESLRELQNMESFLSDQDAAIAGIEKVESTCTSRNCVESRKDNSPKEKKGWIKRSCGVCANCMLPDCGKCIPCLDKTKFGGPNKRHDCFKMRKRLIQRINRENEPMHQHSSLSSRTTPLSQTIPQKRKVTVMESECDLYMESDLSTITTDLDMLCHNNRQETTYRQNPPIIYVMNHRHMNGSQTEMSHNQHPSFPQCTNNHYHHYNKLGHGSPHGFQVPSFTHFSPCLHSSEHLASHAIARLNQSRMNDTSFQCHERRINPNTSQQCLGSIGVSPPDCPRNYSNPIYQNHLTSLPSIPPSHESHPFNPNNQLYGHRPHMISHSPTDYMGRSHAHSIEHLPRRIGRIRRWSQNANAYGSWEDIMSHEQRENGSEDTMCTVNETRLQLRRGGLIRFFGKLVPSKRRHPVVNAMISNKLYRQYYFGPGKIYLEPRVHVLLSSKVKNLSEDQNPNVEEEDTKKSACNPGYTYHGVKMKAQPLSLVPEVFSLALDLANFYRITEWNIGVDMIIYRSGDDGISWHADDTQAESVILCAVIESQSGPRPVKVRPKLGTGPKEDGDEEIELYVDEGDAYEMDGIMQKGYEHCLPKQKNRPGRRSVLIFRHGNEGDILKDSGVGLVDSSISMAASDMNDSNTISSITDILAPPKKCATVLFGKLEKVLIEGKALYSRGDLFLNRAHRADQRGVNGNIIDGCDSVVVSRQSRDFREDDGLSWIQYTSSRMQGGGALCKSFFSGHQIRVFRSSNLDSPFAPPPRDQGRTSYRYDGLYKISKMWDNNGDLTTETVKSGGDMYTFLLQRSHSHDEKARSPSMEMNQVNDYSVQDLWDEIQRSKAIQNVDPLPLKKPWDKIPALPKKAEPLLSCSGHHSDTKSVQPLNHPQPHNAMLKSMVNHSSAFQLNVKVKHQSKFLNYAVHGNKERQLVAIFTHAPMLKITKNQSSALQFKVKVKDESKLLNYAVHKKKKNQLVATIKQCIYQHLFPLHEKVYVDQKSILYEATILKYRYQENRNEYRVHFKGYNKNQDSWADESMICTIQETSTQKFLEQRNLI